MIETETNMGEEQSKTRVVDDLIEDGFKNNLHTLASLTTAGVIGYAQSWCAPLAMPRIIKKLDRETMGSEVSLYRVAHGLSEGLGYLGGLLHHVEWIARDPQDWKSYIPVATNLAGRAAGYVYDNVVFGKVSKQF